MTQANTHAGNTSSGRSKLEALGAYIRYGSTILRREGLRYFLIRCWRFITGELANLNQVILLKLHMVPRVKLISIEDIEYQPPSQANLELEIPSIPPKLQPAQPSSDIISDMHDDLVLRGILSHNQQLIERNTLLQQGNKRYSGRSVLFLAPIGVLSGGANLIIQAARAMQRMGVFVQIFNLNIHRHWFERNFKDLDIPVIFADVDDVPAYGMDMDSVIATSNPTVSWIDPLMLKRPNLPIGYYIQDYEPYFYPQGSHEFKRAVASYSLVPGMVRMATTAWISDLIRQYHQLDCKVVGVHMDIDMFRPRPRASSFRLKPPLQILGMIRPSTPRRNPKMTISILKQISEAFGDRVEITLFGCKPTEPGFASLVQNLPCQLAGQLRSTQMARLLNQADIFVDFSDFQALGLTALESMACGVAVIVPARGGTDSYAIHEENCLVVDTQDKTACYQALQRLVEDDPLRSNIQANAISTASRFFPERTAFNMLNAVFSEN